MLGSGRAVMMVPRVVILGRRGQLDLSVERPQPLAMGRCHGQGKFVAQAQGRQLSLKIVEGYPSIDQGGQTHVASNARGTIEVS